MLFISGQHFVAKRRALRLGEAPILKGAAVSRTLSS